VILFVSEPVFCLFGGVDTLSIQPSSLTDQFWVLFPPNVKPTEDSKNQFPLRNVERGRLRTTESLEPMGFTQGPFYKSALELLLQWQMHPELLWVKAAVLNHVIPNPKGWVIASFPSETLSIAIVIKYGHSNPVPPKPSHHPSLTSQTIRPESAECGLAPPSSLSSFPQRRDVDYLSPRTEDAVPNSFKVELNKKLSTDKTLFTIYSLLIFLK
jgi:hypothetical protein